MKDAALILVDIQNDFVPGGAWRCRRATRRAGRQSVHADDSTSSSRRRTGIRPITAASPPIIRARSVGDVIDLHGLPQMLWPVHCVQGTRGAAVRPGLDTAAIATGVPERHRPGDRQLQRLLRQRPPQSDRAGRVSEGAGCHATCTSCGLATDYCVKFTALDAPAAGVRHAS